MAKKSGKGNAAVESMRKAFLVGLGAMVRTTDKVKEYVDDLVDQGALSQSEGRLLGEDLKKLIQQERKHFEQWVDASIKKMLDSLDLVTRDELEDLRKELGLKATPAKPTHKPSKLSGAKKSSAKKMAKKTTTKKTTAKKAAVKKVAVKKAGAKRPAAAKKTAARKK